MFRNFTPNMRPSVSAICCPSRDIIGRITAEIEQLTGRATTACYDFAFPRILARHAFIDDVKNCWQDSDFTFRQQIDLAEVEGGRENSENGDEKLSR